MQRADERYFVYSVGFRNPDGEIDMLMDDSEVRVKAGDVLVQQGTNQRITAELNRLEEEANRPAIPTPRAAPNSQRSGIARAGPPAAVARAQAPGQPPRGAVVVITAGALLLVLSPWPGDGHPSSREPG